ncbi:restriction endonuclease subunit S [Proteus terrae]|uniref:restriction endonuclease subunit S n=1 Tax=Proteus terrae TaxID=1574161 RepID=UPI001CBCF1A7|nr:restriction endonuclease subunit S [Proteus terrae]UAX02110.1 restriction endonuclease subunit S [Proteus terrae subsp. cibarius]
MSELSFMERLLDGVEVEWMLLDDVGAFLRGKRFVKTDMKSEGVPCIHYGEMYTHFGIWAEQAKSFLDIDVASKLRVANPGDVIIVAAGETIEDIGNGTAWLGSSDVVFHDACFSFKSELNPKYVAYYLRTNVFKEQIRSSVSSGKISSINAKGLGKARIPIPCPNNPKKSLEIQAEIVRILDAFTAMTAELTAELNLRKKQYNYYRDQLLSFEEGEVEWKALGEACGFRNGFAFKSNLFREAGLPIVRITNLNGSGVDLTDVKYFDPTDYRENTQSYSIARGDILIAMSGATTGKIGCFDSTETAYLNQRVGKFVPDSKSLDNRYLYHFLLSKTEQIYVLAGGGAQPNLSSKVLMEKMLIPIPYANDPIKSIFEQKRIADILDKLDILTNSITEGLPREIELRQKQYEYYRDLLLSFPKLDSEVA